MTIINPKIREAMERKTDAELQGVVAHAETWTAPAVEAAREEMQRRGVREKLSCAEWLARWPGRAFAEEDDAPETGEGGEWPVGHYLDIVESRCLYCGAREPLQFHPFVVSARPSMEPSRAVAAAAVLIVGRSLGVPGAALVSGMVGRSIMNGGKALESLLLHFVLCDGCAEEPVNEENGFPPEVYALHPWVEPLAQVGYEVMELHPDRSMIVEAAKRLKSPPSAVGITMV